MKREKMTRSKAKGLAGVILFIVAFQGGMLFYKVFYDRKITTEDELPCNEVAEKIVARDSNHTIQSDTKSVISIPIHRSVAKPVQESKPKEIRSSVIFRFDPNTVSIEQLCSLGFSEKQALVIDNYRKKGGSFRQKEDFAKIFVVSPEMYDRLKDSIYIRKGLTNSVAIELNSADSAQLVSLKGIGAYYARKIMAYRDKIGGFAKIEQLLEIRGIDEDRLNCFKDNVKIDLSRIQKVEIRHADLKALCRLPYIKEYDARAIILYRESRDSVTYDDLIKNNVLRGREADILKYYLY